MEDFDSDYLAIRDRIFELLDSEPITQKEFAEIVDVSPQTITDWKKGKSTSYMRKLALIAHALRSTTQWLFTGTGNRSMLEERREIAIKALTDTAEKKPATENSGGQAEKLAQILRDVGINVDALSEAEMRKVGKIIKAALDE